MYTRIIIKNTIWFTDLLHLKLKYNSETRFSYKITVFISLNFYFLREWRTFLRTLRKCF